MLNEERKPSMSSVVVMCVQISRGAQAGGRRRRDCAAHRERGCAGAGPAVAKLSAAGGRHGSVCTCGARRCSSCCYVGCACCRECPVASLPNALAHEEGCSLLMSYATCRRLSWYSSMYKTALPCRRRTPLEGEAASWSAGCVWLVHLGRLLQQGVCSR